VAPKARLPRARVLSTVLPAKGSRVPGRRGGTCRLLRSERWGSARCLLIRRATVTRLQRGQVEVVATPRLGGVEAELVIELVHGKVKVAQEVIDAEHHVLGSI
jgi:hypothetical protein